MEEHESQWSSADATSEQNGLADVRTRLRSKLRDSRNQKNFVHVYPVAQLLGRLSLYTQRHRDVRRDVTSRAASPGMPRSVRSAFREVVSKLHDFEKFYIEDPKMNATRILTDFHELSSLSSLESSYGTFGDYLFGEV